MDKQINPSTSNSTANVINNIHNMQWLKQNSSSENSKMHPSVGKNGQILSSKKTDEDYFPGTREEKKARKRKENKSKSAVSICNLEDLINLTQHCDKTVTPDEDLEEITEYTPSSKQKEPEPVSFVNQTIAANSVWSTTTSTADKLFPNVQSVVIDGQDEEEMFSRAIAESIATIQLEQFNKPSPIKEDRWESLYGDDDDEGGWDNIKRNLPPAETMETDGEKDTSGQRKRCDDNNNSSKIGGILKNKQENSNHYSLETEELDFGFKKSSKDEMTTAPSLKSVSFNESISVKVRSRESSENDECEKTLCSNKKEFIIDKYGRIDGYSEKRLFMGKGARLREIEFIQKQCSLGVEDMRCKKFQTNDIQKSTTTPSQCSENSQSKIPIPNLEEHKIESEISTRNLHKLPETGQEKFKSDSTAVIETQNPVKITSQCPKNIQSLKSISDIQSPEPKKAGAVKNANGTSKIPKNTKQIAYNTENMAESVVNSSVDEPLSESLSVIHDSTSKGATKSCNEHLSSVELKLENSEKTELEPPKSRAQTMKGTKNIETPHKTVFSTSDGRQMKAKQISQHKNKSVQISQHKNKSEQISQHKNKSEQINQHKNKSVSPRAKSITSDNENKKKEIINPSQREEILDKKATEDLDENISLSEDAMSKNLAAALRIVNNVSETEPESNGRCLVPTLVREDEYTPNFPSINFEYTDSTANMLNAEFQSPACQNLLLAGVSCVDSSSNGQSWITCDLESENLQYQNYSIQNSVPQNSLHLQSETFNNTQHIQPTYINGGEQIYQNTSISQEKNWNTNTNSVSPNYTNMANTPQMNQADYAYLLHHLGPQNLPYQSMGRLMNPDDVTLSSFVESRENLYSGNNIEDSVPSHERTQDDGRRYSTRAPPGFVKNVQLPPGFTRRQFIQRDDTNKDDRVINPPTAAKSVNDVKSKQRGNCKKKSQLGSTNNYGEATWNRAQCRPAYGGRKPTPDIVQTNSTHSKNRQNHHNFQNGSIRQESNSTENRKIPYPILGASQNSHEKCTNSESDISKSTQSPTLQRDVIIIQSSSSSQSVLNTVNDNMREISMETSSINNNHFLAGTQSTTVSFDHQGINSPTNIPQSGLPINYQIPADNMANWQYNVNLMNSPQVPIGFVPNCQIPVTNPNNFIINAPVDYFEAPIYQNVVRQQLPMQMLNQAQIPMYSNPHDFNAEGNNLQNVRPENIESYQLNSISNHDPSVAMQQSMVGTPSCGNYNLNETSMDQFMSNSNFYKTGTMPDAQESWSVHNSQFNNMTGQVFNNTKTGKGRGRLIKKRLS